MLPGLRFLFAATVLTMSILIFGLGAAALLRSAHVEIANAPSRRSAPEPKFAQPSETSMPVLALLRVEPAPAEPTATENAPATAAAGPPAIAAEFDRIAALKPEASSPTETANPTEPARVEIASSAPPAQREAAPAQTETPTAAEPTRIAAIAEVLPPASEAAPAVSEQATAPPSTDADPVAMKIATLGGPPVTIKAQPATKAADATSDKNAAKKRLQAKRAKERRRLAQRARQAATQQAADPFSQPTITTRTR